MYVFNFNKQGQLFCQKSVALQGPRQEDPAAPSFHHRSVSQAYIHSVHLWLPARVAASHVLVSLSDFTSLG